jgi:VWFA-related protein
MAHPVPSRDVFWGGGAMFTKRLIGAISLGVCAAALIAGRLASQSVPATTGSQASNAPQTASGQSGYVLKVTTRLVTLDLIATDSHGSPVRDLKPEELQILEEHKAQQKIEHFEYFEKLKNAAAPISAEEVNRKSTGVISNQLPLDRLKISPTVLLMDTLNTTTSNQMQGRAHMLQLLRTLPPDTPIAVFVLGTSLRILQDFTSDPALLRAALDHSLTGNTVQINPALDTKNTSNFILDTTGGLETSQGLAAQIGEIQNFEKEEYSMTLDLRAKETLGAMAEIGQYLSGIPGRKNLIWLSESFPLSVAPDPDTGNNPFAGIREYSDQVKTVANALTDAQVAVYPMDVRGLQAQESLSASQSISLPQSRTNGTTYPGRLHVEGIELQQSQNTMDALAQDTGGKACKNNNDLAGCVMTALKDSSSYYEISFYPQNVNWDGKFHKLTVKSSRSGVKLSYRRGYYALDASTLAKRQPVEDHLRQACADQLPSTTIPLTVQPIPLSGTKTTPAGLQYLLMISAAGITGAQEADAYSLNLRVADCEFAQDKTTIFRFNERELPKSVSAEVFRSWQARGIPDHVALMPNVDTRRIRLVVLDVSSGLTGAIDIPVLPDEIAKAREVVQPPPPVATTPYLELPDKIKGSSPPKILASLTFHLGAAASGTLDWSGDSLLYNSAGEMPLDKAANGFSGYAFGDRFHCHDGHFSAVDPSDGEPAMRFTFHNHSGKMVVVDLKGEQPVYIGDLPVDPTARSFFEELWQASHCQAQ